MIIWHSMMSDSLRVRLARYPIPVTTVWYDSIIVIIMIGASGPHTGRLLPVVCRFHDLKFQVSSFPGRRTPSLSSPSPVPTPESRHTELSEGPARPAAPRPRGTPAAGGPDRRSHTALQTLSHRVTKSQSRLDWNFGLRRVTWSTWRWSLLTLPGLLRYLYRHYPIFMVLVSIIIMIMDVV